VFFPAKDAKHPKRAYFGVELEVQADSGDDTEVLDKLGREHVYLKEDSSIDDSGFEIVTHPHTIAEHRKRWAKFFESVPGSVSGDSASCGMHVHISLDALTTLQIHRMRLFLYSPENARYIRQIAGRTSSYAKPKAVSPRSLHCSTDRYQGLNTLNEHTVEIRIFASTTDAATFWARLEFCDALRAYCASEHTLRLSVSGFVNFVSVSKFSYRNLHNHNVELSYAQGPAVKPEYIGRKVAKKNKAHKKQAPSVADTVVRIIDEMEGTF
jgi:hypothetical protein